MKPFPKGAYEIDPFSRSEVNHGSCPLSHNLIDDLKEGLFRSGHRDTKGPPKEELLPIVDLQMDELSWVNQPCNRIVPQDEMVVIRTDGDILDDGSFMVQTESFHQTSFRIFFQDLFRYHHTAEDFTFHAQVGEVLFSSEIKVSRHSGGDSALSPIEIRRCLIKEMGIRPPGNLLLSPFEIDKVDMLCKEGNELLQMSHHTPLKLHEGVTIHLYTWHEALDGKSPLPFWRLGRISFLTKGKKKEISSLIGFFHIGNGDEEVFHADGNHLLMNPQEDRKEEISRRTLQSPSQ